MQSALAARTTPQDRQLYADEALAKLSDIRSQREGSEWYQEREKFERIAASDFSHRRTDDIEAQTIFDKSNQSLQIVRSVRRYLCARVSKDIFGSSPWFSVKPQGTMDQALAEQIQPHAGWKLDEASYEAKAKEAIGIALDLGEVAIKTTWKKEEDVFDEIQTILVGPDGRPVLDGEGEYFYDTDDAIDAETGEAPAGEADIESPEETAEESGLRVFAKDPTIPLPAPGNGFEWQDHLIENKVKLYSGLHVAPIYWKDVYWDLNVACLQEADFVAHEYDAKLDDLQAQFNADGKNAEVQAMIDLANETSPGPKAYAGQPKPEQGESGGVSSHDCGTDYRAPIKITEVYQKRLINGRMTRVWMVIATEQSVCIWMDYVAAISPRSQWPIHLITVNKVAGRAYGRGLYKVFELAADTIDRLINGVIYRNLYNSDPVKVWNPDLVKGTEVNRNLKLRPGGVLEVAQTQVEASKILQIIEIPDLDERTWQLLELFMQLIQVESGVTNANQGDLSDLPQNTTATGINSMLESSSVLHLFILQEFRDGLNPQLTYAVELLYMRQDEDETYEYLEGQANAVLALADAQELRKLRMNVKILLSRARRQELRQAAMAAIPTGIEFHQLVDSNPDAAKRLRKLFIQVFRGLEIDDAEQMFPTAEEIDLRTAQIQQAAAAAAQAESKEKGGKEEPQEAPLPDNVIPAAMSSAA